MCVSRNPCKVMSSSEIMTAWALAYHNTARTTSEATAADITASGPLLHQHSLARSSRNGRLAPVANSPGRAAGSNHDSSEPSAENLSNAQPSSNQAAGRRETFGSSIHAAAAGSRQQSSSTNEPGTPTGTAHSLLSQHFGTGGKRSGLGKSRLTGDSCAPDTTTAVLKARSDAAVLKDLKLGPLLGQGCYGRVYRGRWKATPVAVKIIDHYSSNEGVGSSRGNRISAGREMLFGKWPTRGCARLVGCPSFAEHTHTVTTLLTCAAGACYAPAWLRTHAWCKELNHLESA
jgi:hypothetical protein